MRNTYVKASLIGLVVGVLLMATAGSAFARDVHIITGTLGAGELSLSEQSGVALNQETKDVYVADTGHGHIARFVAGGGAPTTLATATAPTFLAVDNSATGGSKGDIYVVEQGDKAISKLDPSGAPVTGWGTAGRLEGFGTIAGVAVDSSGSLYVLEADAALHTLTASGSPSGQCTVPLRPTFFNNELVPNVPHQVGLAVDSSGDLFFVHGYEELIAKVTSSCLLLTENFPSKTEWRGLAVDESDDSLFSSTGASGGGPPPELRHFASSGSQIEQLIGHEEGLTKPGQLAVRSDNHALYVADATSVAVLNVVNIEPPHVTINPPTAVMGTSAHFSAQIDPEAAGSESPAYNVRYRFQCIPSCPSGSGLSGVLKGTSGAEIVEGTAEHLLPGSTYDVYITAENAGGAARAPAPPQQGLRFETAPIAPTIGNEWVAEASDTTVTVAATVEPGGTEARYKVQYVTKSQFEASGFAEAMETPEQPTAGAEAVTVTAKVLGLEPLKAYVMRVLVANAIGNATGAPIAAMTLASSLLSGGCPANESLRSGAAAFLPDCRAYELVSPTNKNGGNVEAVPGSLQAPGTEGRSVTFFSQAGIAGGVGAQDYPTFLSTRDGEAWTTQGLLPPQALGERGDFLGLTPDGRYAISEATSEARSGGGTGLFARDMETGEVTTIVPYNSGCGSAQSCFTLSGASTDGLMIFFETHLELDKEPPTILGPRNVYVWSAASHEVSLVGVDEGNADLIEGAFGGAYDWPQGKLGSGSSSSAVETLGEHMYAQAINAVSEDGDQMVYTARGPAGHGQLYVRLGLKGASPQTVKVSQYAPGREGPELPAAFLEATPDGRYIYFKSTAALTSDAFSGEGTDSLYRYDVSKRKLIDVTNKKLQTGPGVAGLLGASKSGQIVYFVATGKLTAAAGPGGTTAKEGEANIYRWQEGAIPSTTFIATVQNGALEPEAALENDSRDWSPFMVYPGNTSEVLSKTARVNSDGTVVVFSSHRALTNAPNQSRGCNPLGRQQHLAPCAEFFRYSATTNSLQCVSCNPSGALPLEGATIGTGYINAADNPIVFAAPVLPRNLSADGNRFFFQTPDSLVPNDANGSGCTATPSEAPTCMDVYEWEAAGTGTCSVPTAEGGCLSLISSGVADEPSFFVDADPRGENAFFMSPSQLVGADRDELYDVYDARVGGGIPSQNESAPPSCVSQQACQGPQVGAGPGGSPGTHNFVGPGNGSPPVCKKGFVRKHGKCVKKAKRKPGAHKDKNHKKNDRTRRTGVGSHQKRTAHQKGGKR